MKNYKLKFKKIKFNTYLNNLKKFNKNQMNYIEIIFIIKIKFILNLNEL